MSMEIDNETGEVTVVEATAAEFVARGDAAALDVQVSTAKQYPRSIQRFESDLKSWCTRSKDGAMECFFNLKRGGSTIIGPSVRFAELVVTAWGNIVVDTAIVTEEKDHVVVTATCRDLERNTAMRAQVRRNILTRDGRRFGADMIQTTIQAASAIARRNAIFQTVPRALWEPLWQEARRVALGDAATFTERRQAVLKELKAIGANPAHIKHALGGKEPKDLSGDDILVLEVSLRRIQNGESRPEVEFPRPENDGEERGESAQKATEALDGSKGSSSPKKPAEGVSEADPVDEAFGLSGGDS